MPLLRRELAAARLECSSLRLLCTPRRIVLHGTGVPVRQDDREIEVFGPPAGAARDAEGRFTTAALRFAQAHGAAERDLRMGEKGGRKVVCLTKREAGLPAPEILARLIPGTLASVEIPRAMRWNAAGNRFSRPVRWVCALWENELIPMAIAGIPAAAATRGHRLLAPGQSPVATVSAYFRALAAEGKVMIDPDDRARLIADLIGRGLPSGETVEPADISRAAGFVEHPCLEVGAIDEDHAHLPPEVISVVVRKLNALPVSRAGAGLAPRFCIVADGIAGDGVRAGYEAVLAARLEDARFFMEQDGKRPLADFAGALERILYHPRWGSVAQRAARIRRMAAMLAAELRFDADATRLLDEAAALCKNDLATQMVTEFPSLQGVIGRVYALRDGADPAVADAIEQHYRPRTAGDRLPDGLQGALLAVVDRLETLSCFFGAGGSVGGSGDPFGLKRAAAGLIEIIWDRRLVVPCRALVAECLRLLGAPPGAAEAVMAFLRQRAENLLVADAVSAGLRRAVTAAAGEDFVALREKTAALQAFLAEPGGVDILVPFSRAANILRQAGERGIRPGVLSPELLVESAERELHALLVREAPRLTSLEERGAHLDFLRAARALKEPVDRFFDTVLVLCPEEDLRANRLALLALVNTLFLRFADLSHITPEDIGHAAT